MSEVMENENANRVQLSESLQCGVTRLHRCRLSLGMVVLILGGVSVGIFKPYAYMPVVAAGMASLLVGLLGIAASKAQSLPLHTACMAASALGLLLSFMAYNLCVTICMTEQTGYKKEGLVISDLLLLVLDQVMAALVIGYQASVIYISTRCTPCQH